MTGRTGNRLRAAIAGAVVALVVAGCSSGGGAAAGNSTAPPQYGPAEKTTLNVGVVPAMDSAGFFVAMDEGLFTREGLTINYSPAVSSETAVQQQLKGQLDITGGNYVSYINEVAVNHEPLEVVAEGSLMTPGSQVIYTPANSVIKSVDDLAGHTIGVNAPNNIDYLLDVSVLSGYGIKLSQVHFPKDPVAFPSMAQTLDNPANGLSAATMPEPFASLAEQQYGMVPLVDLDQGATAQFPIEGYVVTKQWAQQHPHTLERFLAALEEGQKIADTNRGAVEKAFEDIKAGPGSSLPAAAFGQVPASIASEMTLNTYPIGVDQTRIQRVADVMHQYGLLPSRFNVSSMIISSSQFDFAPFTNSSS
jgi:NitT/TauT family transport system substrate-binding protein